MVQWLRICLSMQGTHVRSLVQEDPTCHGATEPTHLVSPCIETVLQNTKAHSQRTCTTRREATEIRSSHITMREYFLFLAAFLGLTHLEELDLSNNSLQNFDYGVLEDLYFLKLLWLRENPWRCDYNIHYLYYWLKHHYNATSKMTELSLFISKTNHSISQ